jgi:two-component system, OmpR family, sensor histidine kinase KdpD
VKESVFTNNRPDAFLRMIRRAHRGRLKIYLGYGAGVGKTYQMLQEGHRLKAEGIDVVIGLLETHGRIDIVNLAHGLEVVPRRSEEYRGVLLEEMDLDGVLSRRPQVALIDELAHTNAPGSVNPKRYQDVQDVLSAGIHVISTLNVQHLESLYDTVQQEVRIRVRERIPDSVLLEADDIVNVDLTPEDLRKRLQEGKIYPSDRIPTALHHFFTASNLETLRELTLRELAAQIDLRRREHIEEPEVIAPDQVMVCLSSRGPNSEMLLRYASRLAGRLNRNWYALYVQTPAEAPTIVDSHTQDLLSNTLTLAKQLGALVFTYKGEDVVAAILRFAKEYRVGHIVIGSPGRMPPWKRFLKKRNLVERLVEEARNITIVVVDTRSQDSEPPVRVTEPRAARLSADGTSENACSRSMPLSSFLSVNRILFWEQPVATEVALRELVLAVARDGIRDPDMVLIELLKREQESSTFCNEGVAFPHARLAGLSSPIVALGVPRHGVSDACTDKPIRLIFLILTPEEEPNVQVRLLGRISVSAQDRHLVERLVSAKNADEALMTIRQRDIDP